MMTKDATEDLEWSLNIAFVFNPGNRTHEVFGLTVDYLMAFAWRIVRSSHFFNEISQVWKTPSLSFKKEVILSGPSCRRTRLDYET